MFALQMTSCPGELSSGSVVVFASLSVLIADNHKMAAEGRQVAPLAARAMGGRASDPVGRAGGGWQPGANIVWLPTSVTLLLSLLTSLRPGRSSSGWNCAPDLEII